MIATQGGASAKQMYPMYHTIGRTYMCFECFERNISVVDSAEAIRGGVLKVATYKVRMAFNRHQRCLE